MVEACGQNLCLWYISLATIGLPQCSRLATHLTPGGTETGPESFVRTWSFPFMTTPSAPWLTSKYSVCRRWICLKAERLVSRDHPERKMHWFSRQSGCKRSYSGGPERPSLTNLLSSQCDSRTTWRPSSSWRNSYRIAPPSPSAVDCVAVFVLCVGRGDNQSCQLDAILFSLCDIYQRSNILKSYMNRKPMSMRRDRLRDKKCRWKEFLRVSFQALEGFGSTSLVQLSGGCPKPMPRGFLLTRLHATGF